MNTFEKSLEIGKKAESKVAYILEQNGFSVTDVSDDKDYQKQDIDFIIEKDGQEWTFEVKSDSKIASTGNIYFEKGFDRVSGYRQGWLGYCEADWIGYYCATNDTVYIIRFDGYQDYLRECGKTISYWNWTDKCQAYGVVVPLDVMRDEDILVKEYKVSDYMEDEAA